METTRQVILEHAARLAVAEGEVPSLNALASAAGLSKGGLMHHFPSREVLLIAMAADGIAAIDTALSVASGKLDVLRTWLNLSIPDKNGIALFQSMASVFFAGKSEQGPIQDLVKEANERWATLLTRELGSSSAARVALLLGDGLLLGAISGTITSKNANSYLKSAEDAIDALVSTR